MQTEEEENPDRLVEMFTKIIIDYEVHNIKYHCNSDNILVAMADACNRANNLKQYRLLEICVCLLYYIVDECIKQTGSGIIDINNTLREFTKTHLTELKNLKSNICIVVLFIKAYYLSFEFEKYYNLMPSHEKMVFDDLANTCKELFDENEGFLPDIKPQNLLDNSIIELFYHMTDDNVQHFLNEWHQKKVDDWLIEEFGSVEAPKKSGTKKKKIAKKSSTKKSSTKKAVHKSRSRSRSSNNSGSKKKKSVDLADIVREHNSAYFPEDGADFKDVQQEEFQYNYVFVQNDYDAITNNIEFITEPLKRMFPNLIVKPKFTESGKYLNIFNGRNKIAHFSFHSVSHLFHFKIELGQHALFGLPIPPEGHKYTVTFKVHVSRLTNKLNATIHPHVENPATEVACNASISGIVKAVLDNITLILNIPR